MAPAHLVSPIRRLAPEILQEIVAFTPPASHLALCLVSRLFRALCVRAIYADIALHSPAAAAKCCRTVARNAFAASAVRSFEISYDQSSLRLFPSFYELISRALEHITSAQHVALRVPDPSYASVLTRAAIPRLHHFECALPLGAPLATFLGRHRQLRFLQLGAHRGVHLCIRVPLPKLEYFVGNSACVPMLQSAALRAAVLTWDPDSDAGADPSGDVEAPLVALATSSTASLNLLSCRRPGWNLDLLARIAVHLPHIYALSLTNVFDGVAAATLDKVSAASIGEQLARFTSLQRLAIACIDVCSEASEAPMEMDPLDEIITMDAAFAGVTAWGAACPTLLECTLPDTKTIRWVRVVENLWLPSGHPSSNTDPSVDPAPATACATKWVWARLRAHTYPGWPRIVRSVACTSVSTYPPCPYTDGEGGVGGGGGSRDAERLEALRRAALDHAYTDCEAARGFARVVLGGAGIRIDEQDEER